jgi:hypothetical protein
MPERVVTVSDRILGLHSRLEPITLQTRRDNDFILRGEPFVAWFTLDL